MKGLLLLNASLLKQRRQTLLMFILAFAVMAISTNGSFIVGYTSIIGAIAAISTISYDEADNGLMFLMTLPFERKTYVVSKYITSLISCFVFWLVGVVLMLAVSIFQGVGFSLYDLISAVSVIIAPLTMVLLLIPLQLKYGAEKSRIVYLVFSGAIIAIVLVCVDKPVLRSAAASAVRALDSVNASILVLSGLALLSALTALSVIASVRIMDKKSF